MDRLEREHERITAERRICQERFAARCREAGEQRNAQSEAAVHFRALQEKLRMLTRTKEPVAGAARRGAALAGEMRNTESRLQVLDGRRRAAEASAREALHSLRSAEVKQEKVAALQRAQRFRREASREEQQREELVMQRVAGTAHGSRSLEQNTDLPASLPQNAPNMTQQPSIPVANTSQGGGGSAPAPAAPEPPAKAAGPAWSGTIERLRSWNHGGVRQLSFSYETGKGGSIFIQLSAVEGRGLRVQLIPEVLRHRVILGNERQHLLEVLARRGIRSAEVSVHGRRQHAR